jgi:clan AA aspartic protease (TIGR02281 family)
MQHYVSPFGTAASWFFTLLALSAFVDFLIRELGPGISALRRAWTDRREPTIELGPWGPHPEERQNHTARKSPPSRLSSPARQCIERLWLLIEMLFVAALTPMLGILAIPLKERLVQIRIDQSSGQFFTLTLVNGQAVRMLVDTGAWTVMLCQDDAKQIGIDVDKLTYSLTTITANGPIHVAPVKLSSLIVQSIGLSDVVAVVPEPQVKCIINLLGMSFMNRLKSYEFSGDTLTLRE